VIEGEEEEEDLLLTKGKLRGAAATPLPLSYQYTRIKPGILPVPYTAAGAPGLCRLWPCSRLHAWQTVIHSYGMLGCSLVCHALLEASRV
jgi:hypothetical protein